MIDEVAKPNFFAIPSFPCRRESSHLNTFWIPACAGMTAQKIFYESIMITNETQSTSHYIGRTY